MTKHEMDVAIRAAMYAIPRSIVTHGERVCFLAGMREAAKIADDMKDGAYPIAKAINNLADELSKAIDNA